MSTKAFDSIMAGLQDALAYTKGDKTRGRATTFEARDLDVGKVRGKVGLSQGEFARAFGVSDPVSILKALRLGPKGPVSKRRRVA